MIKHIAALKLFSEHLLVVLTKCRIGIVFHGAIKIFQNINLPKISLIECKLETGRTHQIRVHMTYKGNPILGDKSYKKKLKKLKNIDEELNKIITKFNRQCLHAKSLGFLHPTTNKNLFFEAELPDDINKIVKKLRTISI